MTREPSVPMMDLRAGWYVVAEEGELDPNRPNALRRFGADWVIWRTSRGDWILQPDVCPHRSALLSLGTVVDDCIACPFHGFRFDASGKCAHVPEINRDAPGLTLPTRRLARFQGFVWLNIGISTETPIPWFDDLPGTSSGTHQAVEWAQHFSRCVENQLDHTHLPFVHANTIGAGSRPDRKAETRVDSRGILVSLGSQRGRESNFHFLFPGIWRLGVSSRMKPFLAFVPIDESRTRIYLRTYQSYVTLPVLAHLTGAVMKLSNGVILGQDHRVVIGQRPGNVLEAKKERLFPGDAAIQAYRRWLAGEEPQSG